MEESTNRIGKSEILEDLGRGGFAGVYKARDPNLDQVVALKVLSGSHAERQEVIQRFIDEARRAVRLKHRNIVRIYAVGEENRVPYIAMEYLPGGTLADRRQQGLLSHRFPPEPFWTFKLANILEGTANEKIPKYRLLRTILREIGQLWGCRSLSGACICWEYLPVSTPPGKSVCH